MTADLYLFLAASVVLTLAPGPDNLFVVTLGVSRGKMTAIVTAWGMCSGIIVHTIAAACGISAILHTSAVAFNLVKLAGAGYLLYLAWKTLRSESSLRPGAAEITPARELFRRGFLMNLLNPKVALFFLAFLPQFVRPGQPVPLQMLLLGTIFMAQAFVLFTLIGYFSGSLGSFVTSRPRVARWFDYLTAGLFSSLGIRLALSGR